MISYIVGLHLSLGFLFTGEMFHHFMTDAQYIAPLMANFDPSLSPDAQVLIYFNRTG